jgi:DNA replication and repair protein RecF
LFIASLQLQNFRNYEEVRVDFSERTNLILGDNGRGKTNLLESVYLLSTSKSFRRASDEKLTKRGNDGYLVSAAFHGEDSAENTIVLEYRDHRKSLSINGVRERRISDLIGQVFCVLLSFEDIHLVTGPPYLRRGFLDLILSTVDPLYFDALKTYMQVIKQKNRYLNDADVYEGDLLTVWNDQLIRAGFYILEKRIELITFFNGFMSSKREQLKQFSSPPSLIYRSTVPGIGEKSGGEELRTRFEEILLSRMDAEMRHRRAVYGPHRDDFSFYDGESEIRYFGSIGEARLSSIMLKLAQGAYYRELRKVYPIILVDDILLELDTRNRESVLSLFGNDNQLLITTTERPKLPELFSPDRVFHIREEGCIE